MLKRLKGEYRSKSRYLISLNNISNTKSTKNCFKRSTWISENTNLDRARMKMNMVTQSLLKNHLMLSALHSTSKANSSSRKTLSSLLKRPTSRVESKCSTNSCLSMWNSKWLRRLKWLRTSQLAACLRSMGQLYSRNYKFKSWNSSKNRSNGRLNNQVLLSLTKALKRLLKPMFSRSCRDKRCIKKVRSRRKICNTCKWTSIIKCH